MTDIYIRSDKYEDIEVTQGGRPCEDGGKE